MTTLDDNVILEMTRGVSREAALKFREDLRRLLRTVEDMHELPRSFETKREEEQRKLSEHRLIHHE